VNDRRYRVLYRTLDYHVAGQPLRIVVDGVVPPPGVTVGDRRIAAIQGEDGGRADRARRLLCHEPRGHAGMSGCFVVPADPTVSGARRAVLGALFWNRGGFATTSGHGTIALATWAVDDGLVDVPEDGVGDFWIDVPSGRIRVSVRRSRGAVVEVTLSEVLARVCADVVTVPTSAGPVQVAVAFGGAFYACVRASDLRTAVRAESLPRIVELSHEVRAWFTRDQAAIAAVTHLRDPRLSGLHGTIWFEDVARTLDPPLVHQRNITVYADGAVGRAPSGSGTSARMALLHRSGELRPESMFWNEGLSGGSFHAWLGAEDGDGVLTAVRGSAYRTGAHTFVVDPADQFSEGFFVP
jgi:proline racemase